MFSKVVDQGWLRVCVRDELETSPPVAALV